MGIPARDHHSPFDDTPSDEELSEQLAASQLVIDQLEARVADLEAQLQSAVADNDSLRDRIGRLESELGRHSENSSKPPSTDPMAARKSRAERRAQARAERSSGRPQGKQPGAPGAHLARRVATTTVMHTPSACEACGEGLDGAEAVDSIVRQVLDIPKIEGLPRREICLQGSVEVMTIFSNRSPLVRVLDLV